MDKLKSALEALGSSTPTVVADGSSVVMARDIRGQAKSINLNIETESDPDYKPGNAVGPAPADYTAQGGSVICADIISGTFDTMDTSICVKKSKVRAGQVDETPQPSTQDPAVRFITEHKVELIDLLRADHSFILQHVHAKLIITDREYQNIKHTSLPEQAVTEMIDGVIDKGPESCSLFLELLKVHSVLRTYPQLKKITDKM
ncbi:uncharacterized protein si:dkey-10c21.1 [Notolabrus celidotus]|uniref:uncharacterized protein si:dkey-10c21.1 n=1 Tax=Notolabrus celidotus TaxID=1203425 RepID=UPI00148FCAF5|nr:uncharacterized protein si:dkey-10c21.1 [Notolabrus celidotus]